MKAINLLAVLLLLFSCASNTQKPKKQIAVKVEAPVKIVKEVKVKNVKVKDLSGNVKLQDAAKIYKEVIPFVLNKVKKLSSFDMSSCTPKKVYASYARYLNTKTTYFKTYRPKWRWSKAIAYAKGDTIYFNVHKLNRSVRLVVETICHEITHLADQADTACSFGHGNNSPKGKQGTAPYKIGSMCYKELGR